MTGAAAGHEQSGRTFAEVAAARQHLAVVASGPDRLDLFAIGADHQVWSTCRDAKGWNADWFPVSAQPAPVFDATQQQVTAISGEPGQVDLFVIGSDSRTWFTRGQVG